MSVLTTLTESSLSSPQQARLATLEAAFREDLATKHGQVLTEQGKVIPISTETFHPADIFKQMAPVAYETALAEFVNDRIENAQDKACREFPTPMALSLQRAFHGTHDAVTRILLLRDACQACINTLMAIVIGECMHRGLNLASIDIVVGKSTAPKKLLLSHLKSDRMADRLAVVRSVLTWAESNALPLQCVKYVPVSVVDKLQNVHYIRDDISHSETPSPAEAPAIAAAMREELIDVVLELDDLTQFELVRLLSLEPGNIANLEVLYGYGPGFMETRSLTAQGVGKYPTLPSKDYLLIHCDGEYFEAAPYLFSRQDDKGVTEILVLRGYKEKPVPTLNYDVLGRRLMLPLVEGALNPSTACLGRLF